MTTPTFGDGHARLNVDDDNDEDDDKDDDEEDNGPEWVTGLWERQLKIYLKLKQRVTKSNLDPISQVGAESERERERERERETQLLKR